MSTWANNVNLINSYQIRLELQTKLRARVRGTRCTQKSQQLAQQQRWVGGVVAQPHEWLTVKIGVYSSISSYFILYYCVATAVSERYKNSSSSYNSIYTSTISATQHRVTRQAGLRRGWLMPRPAYVCATRSRYVCATHPEVIKAADTAQRCTLFVQWRARCCSYKKLYGVAATGSSEIVSKQHARQTSTSAVGHPQIILLNTWYCEHAAAACVWCPTISHGLSPPQKRKVEFLPAPGTAETG